MGMTIGRTYGKLHADRGLFQNVKDKGTYEVKRDCRLRVHDNVIRDMAIYIGEKEENSLFMASQNLQSFP